MNQNYSTRHPGQELIVVCGVTIRSQTLCEAISEDSNRVMDWLWYAEQMETDAERRYCFERVLYINPHNAPALQSLEKLNAKQATKHSQQRSVSGLKRLFQSWFPRLGYPISS